MFNDRPPAETLTPQPYVSRILMVLKKSARPVAVSTPKTHDLLFGSEAAMRPLKLRPVMARNRLEKRFKPVSRPVYEHRPINVHEPDVKSAPIA